MGLEVQRRTGHPTSPGPPIPSPQAPMPWGSLSTYKRTEQAGSWCVALALLLMGARVVPALVSGPWCSCCGTGDGGHGPWARGSPGEGLSFKTWCPLWPWLHLAQCLPQAQVPGPRPQPPSLASPSGGRPLPLAPLALWAVFTHCPSALMLANRLRPGPRRGR